MPPQIRRTNAGFLVSALLLGQALMTSMFALEAETDAVQVGITLALLVVQGALLPKRTSSNSLQNIRKWLILTGIIVVTGNRGDASATERTDLAPFQGREQCCVDPVRRLDS